MDVHRSFAQIAIVEDGICRDEGRIGVRPEELRAWAAALRRDDEVALEATTNSDAIATLLRPLVRRVVVSNPRKTRAIAEAKVKTDKVDARILAQLLAADFLPGTWVADDRTRMLRRLVLRRTHLVKQRTRVKNQVHAILARNLVPTCPHADLFSGVGRALAGQAGPSRRRVAQRRGAPAAARLPRRRAHPGRPRHRARGDRRPDRRPTDDRARHRRHRRDLDPRRRRRLRTIRHSRPARLLPRPQPARPPIRQRPRQPRTDHQGRTRPGARHARRSRLHGLARPRAAARVLPPRQRPPRLPDRHRRDRPQDDRTLLAPDQPRRGLRLRPPQPQRPQTPQARARRRRRSRARARLGCQQR